MEYKVNEIARHKRCFFIVKKGRNCKNCLFDFENYPYKDEYLHGYTLCYKDPEIECNSVHRKDECDVIFERISEIEALVLAGREEDA